MAGRGARVTLARRGEGDVGPGEVAVAHGRVLLGCAEGSLEVMRVKPDGKREMEASAWAAGLRGGLSWGRV